MMDRTSTFDSFAPHHPHPPQRPPTRTTDDRERTDARQQQQHIESVSASVSTSRLAPTGEIAVGPPPPPPPPPPLHYHLPTHNLLHNINRDHRPTNSPHVGSSAPFSSILNNNNKSNNNKHHLGHPIPKLTSNVNGPAEVLPPISALIAGNPGPFHFNENTHAFLQHQQQHYNPSVLYEPVLSSQVFHQIVGGSGGLQAVVQQKQQKQQQSTLPMAPDSHFADQLRSNGPAESQQQQQQQQHHTSSHHHQQHLHQQQQQHHQERLQQEHEYEQSILHHLQRRRYQEEQTSSVNPHQHQQQQQQQQHAPPNPEPLLLGNADVVHQPLASHHTAQQNLTNAATTTATATATTATTPSNNAAASAAAASYAGDSSRADEVKNVSSSGRISTTGKQTQTQQKKKGGKPKKQLTKEQIESKFHLSQQEAARELDVSVSTLKRRFYELDLGIRWPFPHNVKHVSSSSSPMHVPVSTMPSASTTAPALVDAGHGNRTNIPTLENSKSPALSSHCSSPDVSVHSGISDNPLNLSLPAHRSGISLSSHNRYAMRKASSTPSSVMSSLIYQMKARLEDTTEPKRSNYPNLDPRCRMRKARSECNVLTTTNHPLQQLPFAHSCAALGGREIIQAELELDNVHNNNRAVGQQPFSRSNFSSASSSSSSSPSQLPYVVGGGGAVSDSGYHYMIAPPHAVQYHAPIDHGLLHENEHPVQQSANDYHTKTSQSSSTSSLYSGPGHFERPVFRHSNSQSSSTSTMSTDTASSYMYTSTSTASSLAASPECIVNVQHYPLPSYSVDGKTINNNR